MYEDVPNSNMLDKQMLNQLVNENVKILTQIKIQKGQFLLPFFYVCTKNLQRTLQRMFKEPIFAERPCIIYFK